MVAGGSARPSPLQRIVHHDREDAPVVEIVVAPDVGRDVADPRGRGRHHGVRQIDGAEGLDFHRLAIFEDHEVLGGEAAHRLTLLVEHRDVERDELHAGLEPGRGLGLPGADADRAVNHQREHDDEEDAGRRWGHMEFSAKRDRAGAGSPTPAGTCARIGRRGAARPRRRGA